VKANRKSRDSDQGVTAVVGTLLMMPIVLMIMAFMIMWGNDLVDQMKKFQDILGDMADDVDDLDRDLRILGRNKNVVWEDDFEDVRLDNYQFKNVWDIIDHNPPVADCSESRDTSFSSIHSIEIKTDIGVENGISKSFGGRIGANKITIELAFTIDASNSEEYKQITIWEKENPSDLQMNVGRIQIYSNGDLKYLDDTNTDVLEQNVGYLLADDLGWHTISLTVDFAHRKTMSPQYVSFTLNGEVFDLQNKELYSDPSVVNFDEPKSLWVEIKSFPNVEVSATSYIDDFVLRDHSLSGYENQRPDTPNKPIATDLDGGTFEFKVVTADPEKDMIFYQFDWGDLTPFEWTYGYQSDEEAKMEHSFVVGSSYDVKVRARDINDNYTPWSDPVTMTVL